MKSSMWLWIGIAVATAAIWLLRPSLSIFNLSKTEVDVTTVTVQHKREVDSLNNIINMYIDDQVELSNTVDKLNKQIASLRSTINNREATINQLKNGSNERVSNVTKFTNSDIYKLLSERYKDSTAVK